MVSYYVLIGSQGDGVWGEVRTLGMVARRLEDMSRKTALDVTSYICSHPPPTPKPIWHPQYLTRTKLEPNPPTQQTQPPITSQGRRMIVARVCCHVGAASLQTCCHLVQRPHSFKFPLYPDTLADVIHSGPYPVNNEIHIFKRTEHILNNVRDRLT